MNLAGRATLQVFCVVVCLLAPSCCCKSRGEIRTERSWTFESERARSVSRAWRFTSTNPTAKQASWQVIEDESAPSDMHVLGVVKSDNFDNTYNLAVARGTRYDDLELAVHVKAVAGEEDQGGGPLWRCKDQNNYYIARINPLEQNFRVYVVQDGKRRQLDHAAVDLQADRWYELKVRMRGSWIECFLDGELLLRANDKTFPGPGMVGLWTKADAVTSFDDLEVSPVAREPME